MFSQDDLSAFKPQTEFKKKCLYNREKDTENYLWSVRLQKKVLYLCIRSFVNKIYGSLGTALLLFSVGVSFVFGLLVPGWLAILSFKLIKSLLGFFYVGATTQLSSCTSRTESTAPIGGYTCSQSFHSYWKSHMNIYSNAICPM